MKTLDDIMERKAEKVTARKDRVAKRDEAGVVNKLVVDRTPSGLYWCRYSLSGPVPEALKGMFTHKKHIVTIAQEKNIPIEGM